MDSYEDGNLAKETSVSPEPGLGELSVEHNGTPELSLDADGWRSEVAKRVERYRTRRRAKPQKFPSLQLSFGNLEGTAPSIPLAEAKPPAASGSAADSGDALARETVSPELEPVPRRPPIPHEWRRPLDAADQSSTKIIEFPRSAAIPLLPQVELAEPVEDRPRILEAPEVVPPPPALGGIVIEPPENESKNPSQEGMRPAASLGHRLIAAMIDAVILLLAVVMFATICVRLNPEFRLQSTPISISLFAGGLGAVAALLWALYVFLFVVYVGSTPGLRLARLRLATAEGAPADRKLRRWRILASYLSAISLGLGYVWSILDEDRLCWHDRITRTHIEAIPKTN